MPKMLSQAEKMVEIADFKGMNDTVHPSILNNNVLTNCENSYSNNGSLVKRNGYTNTAYLSSKITEEFTATTYKDTGTTTGYWSTTGTAYAITNSANLTYNNIFSSSYGYSFGRRVFVSSTGIIVALISDASSKIRSQKSSDNGATWTKLDGTAGVTDIETTVAYVPYVSGWIDGSDNIHIVYLTSAYDVRYIKLTYSSGSWTVGSYDKIATITSWITVPGITVTSGGTIWVSFSGSSYYGYTYSSTDGDTWTLSNTWTTEGISETELILNNDKPMMIFLTRGGELYSVEYNGSSWDSPILITSTPVYGFQSVRLSDDNIFTVADYNSTTTIFKFDGSSWASSKNYSTPSSDGAGQLTTDGTRVWFVYGKYISASAWKGYVTYYNGSSWSTDSAFESSTSAFNKRGVPYNIGNSGCICVTRNTTTAVNTYQISATIQSTGYDTGSVSPTFISSTVNTTNNGSTITTTYASCDTVGGTYTSFTSDITTLTQQFIKFKTIITNYNLLSSTLNSIEITYTGSSAAVTVTGLHSWTRNDGEKYLLATGGTNLYLYESNTTWRVIKSNFTTGLNSYSAPFINSLMIGNGTDAIVRFNGKVTESTVTTVNGDATVTGSGTHWNTAGNANQLAAGGAIKLADNNWYTIASVTNDTSLELTVTYPGTGGSGQSYTAYAVPALGGTPPVGKYLASHKNYLFVSGVSAYPTRVYYSAISDATSWPSTNYFDIRTNDGEIVTGLAPLGDYLAITKYDTAGTRKSVHVLSGASPVYWNLRQVTTEYSALDQNGIAVGPNELYMIDKYGFVVTNLSTFRRIDLGKVEGIVGDFVQAYLNKATATYFNDQVIFSVPTSGTKNNTVMIYDLSSGEFTKHTGMYMGNTALYNASGSTQLYFGDQSVNSAVFIWDYGTSDNGSAIDWVIETSDMNFKEYFRLHKFKWLYAFFNPTGSYYVTASYSLDGGTSYTALVPTMSVSGSDDAYQRWRLPGALGSSVRFKFENNAKDEPIEMVRIGVMLMEKGLRRSS